MTENFGLYRFIFYRSDSAPPQRADASALPSARELESCSVDLWRSTGSLLMPTDELWAVTSWFLHLYVNHVTRSVRLLEPGIRCCLDCVLYGLC